MGRTNPTYRDRLRRLEDDWNPFQRALRHEFQDDWRQLWVHAKNFADAGGIQNEPTTMEPFLVTVALGQQRQIRLLKKRVRELEAELADDDPQEEGSDAEDRAPLESEDGTA